ITSWMKDGSNLREDPKHKFTSDGKDRKLNIIDVQLSDTGEYTCVAKNAGKEISCTANLYQDCSLSTCLSPLCPLTEDVVWKKNGEVLKKKANKVQINIIGMQHAVTIQNATEDDAGSYSCEVSGQEDIKTTTSVKVIDQSYVTDAGKPIVMVVPFSAYPKAEADWIYDNVSLPKDNVHTSTDRTEYRLKDPKKSDQGRYKIIIKNKHGEGEAFITLDVIAPAITWKKNDEELKADEEISLHSTARHLSLNISKAKREHSGCYSVNVENDAGARTGICTITVVGESLLYLVHFLNHTGTYLLTVSNPAGSKTVALNVTVLDVPAAPIGPANILEVTPDSMMIEWRPPKDDGGSPITNYIVEKRESNKGTWGGVSSGSLATQLRIARLQRGVEYVVRIRAENKMGIGAPLESKPTVAEHTFMPPSPPGKPQTSDLSEDAVTVGWTMPLSDGGSQITGYIIERRHKGGKWIRVNKTPCRDLRYRVLGLFEGSEYEFRVFAENIAGYSGPSPVSDPCKPCRPISVPGPPVNPRVKDYSKATADLVWIKPNKDGGSPILGYTVEMKKADTDKWKKVNLDDFIKQCAYRVKGLEEGVTYRFRVRASNMIGDGEPREVPESITKTKWELAPLWRANLSLSRLSSTNLDPLMPQRSPR
uniref:Uncharacterized protein n=1 Tax=Echeneis naucrates TaxID=173247 RepID=A0A665TIK0_ECHNA